MQLTRSLLFISFFFVLCLPFSAHANLGLIPTIVYFEDGERYKDVVLLNTTEETKTYEMNWVFFEMQEAGASYKTIEGSLTEFDVSKYVFYTPRRVTIPAKGSQKVRLAFRRPSEVPTGDYYAHLSFSPVDNPKIEGEKTQEQSSAAGVAIRVGYSIPVIVRIGEFQEGAEIGQIQITRSSRNKLVLEVPVKRAPGDYGVIGHLMAYHLPANGQEERLIGEVVNANVFTEIDQRIVPITLTEEISSGHIKVILKSGKKEDDTIFDEETFPIQ